MTAANILLVEDENLVALDVSRKLERAGYTIAGVAMTGAEAVQTAVTTKPDLVLIDIRLRGEIDGIEAATRIRSRLDVPVIYLSTYADATTVTRAKTTEPFGYILKPFTAHELEATIENALHKHSAKIDTCRLADHDLHHSYPQLRKTAVYLHSLQEAERAHIARDIHDEMGQIITGLHLDIAWLTQHLDTAPPLVRERLQAMTNLTKSLGQSVRRIATALRPQILDDLGLVCAIEWLLEDAHKRAGLTYTLTPPTEDIALDDARITSVFRIVQEALTNVLRHADAQHIAVRIIQEPDAFVVEIADDGKGISAAQLTQSSSFGIVGMRERARLWDGDIILHGTPGSGTIVTVTLPRH